MSEPKTHIEDVANAPIDADAALTDEQLEAGGLVPVKAFMRTRASANAARVQKSRAKAEAGEEGRAPRKQLNLTAPADDDARAALKAASEAMLAGAISPADVRSMLTSQPAAPAIDADALDLGRRVQAVLDGGGWRAQLLRRLI